MSSTDTSPRYLRLYKVRVGSGVGEGFIYVWCVEPIGRGGLPGEAMTRFKVYGTAPSGNEFSAPVDGAADEMDAVQGFLRNVEGMEEFSVDGAEMIPQRV